MTDPQLLSGVVCALIGLAFLLLMAAECHFDRSDR